MPLAPQLIAAANDEWKRWGFSVRPLHGAGKIVGKEGVAPYVGYVNDYWRVVGEPTWNGNTPQPWSAAFISFCFKTAGQETASPTGPRTPNIAAPSCRRRPHIPVWRWPIRRRRRWRWEI